MELRISGFETVEALNDFVERSLKGAKLDYNTDTQELIIRTGLTMTDDGRTTTAR